MTTRLQSKSLVIDSSHLDEGEGKIRIELTSVEAPWRDPMRLTVIALGCLAVILGLFAGFRHAWVRAALSGVAGALCFVSTGQGCWRRYLRIALLIAVPLLLAASIGLWIAHPH